MKPRKYQNQANEEIHKAFRAHNNVLCVMPMAAGKTFTASHQIRWHLSEGKQRKKTVWIAHTHELVFQAAKVLKQVAREPVGIMLPDTKPDDDARVQVTSVQTLLERPEMHRDATLLVVDEAHHYLAEKWKLVSQHAPKAKILGLTATPQRQDGKPMGDMFSKLVVGVQYKELLNRGLIVPVRVFTPDRVLRDRYAQDPLEAWLAYGEKSQTLAYCASVPEARALAKRFDNHGISAASITQNTPTEERRAVMEGFREGRIRVLVNVYILTEGLDVPDARCCLLVRAFAFAGNYLQACGRILRAAPGKKDGILIDDSGSWNHPTHGSPCADREYSLYADEPIRLKGQGNGVGSGKRSPKSFGDLTLYLAERGALKPHEQPAPPMPMPRHIARGGQRTAIALAQKRYKGAAKGIEKFTGGI